MTDIVRLELRCPECGARIGFTLPPDGPGEPDRCYNCGATWGGDEENSAVVYEDEDIRVEHYPENSND